MGQEEHEQYEEEEERFCRRTALRRFRLSPGETQAAVEHSALNSFRCRLPAGAWKLEHRRACMRERSAG